MARIDEAGEDRSRIEERLRKMVHRWPEVSGYHLNPEDEVVEGLVRALARSQMQHGRSYCPCRDLSGDPEVDKAKICPCQFHHEEIRRDSHCKCVLFVGDDYDPAKAYAPLEGVTATTELPAVRRRWITLYSNKWCSLSRRTKAWLNEQGLPFEEIDIDRNPDAARQVETWTGGYRSVPTLVIRQIVTEPMAFDLETLFVPSAAVMACILHVTRWCAFSRRARAWLTQRGVAAQVIDIEADAEAAERVRTWNDGNLSVPTMDLTLRLVEPHGQDLARALGLVR